MSNSIKPLLDKRVRMIFDRYYKGRSLTLNDLQYLWLKEPESCIKLARNITEGKSFKGIRLKRKHKVNYGYVEKSKENLDEQKHTIDYISNPNSLDISENDIQETMFSVKLMLENMSENERMDLLNDFNDVFELRQISSQMKYWDDAFAFKMVSYSYEDEEKYEFDKLA